jgi:murein DD-endopeptidase MepM/ murein hydrolase activator NlpD
MKPEEIYGLAPEIGIDNVKYLLGRQAQTNKELNNFNMDKQIVEGAKPPSAIKNKVQGKAIEEMAELEGQKFIQIHGVKPDRDQQVEIMRKVTSESIEKTSTLGPFSWTSEKKLYEMPPDQRNFYLSAQASAEKAKVPPPTDAELTAMWELSKKQTPAKAVAPVPAPTKPVTAAPPDPLQDPVFKARQATLKQAHEESIAATNKKTEELKAQLVKEEAKLAQMDADLNARVAGHGAALRKISESRKPELAAHKAMDAEIDAMPAKVKEEAIVSAYGTDDKVEVAKAEKAMDKAVEEVIKAPKNILTPSSKGGGTVLKPLSGSAPRSFAQPVEGSVSVVPSVTRGASAVNIAAKAGATVKAAAAGVVEFIGNLPRLGEVVIVKHPGDYMTVYGHNAEVGRKVGDQVRQGDQLGSATGGATLFEVRHKGVRVDPMKWLKKVGR